MYTMDQSSSKKHTLKDVSVTEIEGIGGNVCQEDDPAHGQDVPEPEAIKMLSKASFTSYLPLFPLTRDP